MSNYLFRPGDWITPKDLVLGLALGLNWEGVEPWAVSLRRSGFDGDVVLFVLPDAPEELKTNLADLNIQTVPITDFDLQFANPLVPFGKFFPYIGRFLMYYKYLGLHPDYRFVILSDVRDLVFFKNPSEWLQAHSVDDHEEAIVVAGENILHRDQPNNMQWLDGAFREAKDFLEDKEVYCSGLIAGRTKYVRELSLQVYLMGRELSDKVWGVDQPVYNFLLHGPYRENAMVPAAKDGWCLNMVVPLFAGNLNKLLDSSFIHEWPETDGGFPGGVRIDVSQFVIVHQYDRLPSLAENIRKQFKK